MCFVSRFLPVSVLARASGKLTVLADGQTFRSGTILI